MTSEQMTLAFQLLSSLQKPYWTMLVIALGMSLTSPVSRAVETARESQLQEIQSAYRQALDSEPGAARRERFRRVRLMISQAIQELDATAGPGLYVNLGNAALQSDELGQAIAAYRMALQRDPRLVQARDNLRLARSLVPEWVRWDEPATRWDHIFFWNRYCSAMEVGTVAAIAFLLGVLLFAYGFRWRHDWATRMAVLPFVVWMALMSSQLARRFEPAVAVVVVDDVMGRTADSASAAPQLPQPLPVGAEVILRQRRGEWTQVMVAGQAAWVPTSCLMLGP